MRRAFTLIELIFVVVIVGIMALAARNYFIQDDSLYRAARQTLEHIRYAQHLAINQDKFDPKDKMYRNVSGYSSQNLGTYFRGWWQIRFVSSSSLVGYSVYSDYDRQGGIDYSTNNGNNAINPATNIRDGKFLYADPQRRSASSPDVLLDTKYQISNIQFSSKCKAPPNDFEQIGKRYERITSFVQIYKQEGYARDKGRLHDKERR